MALNHLSGLVSAELTWHLPLAGVHPELSLDQPV